MTSSQRAWSASRGRSESRPRTAARRATWLVVAGLAVVIAAVVGTPGRQPVSPAAPSFDVAAGGDRRVPLNPTATAPAAAAASASARPFGNALRGDRHGALGEADGLVPGGASVFDDQTPAVANLDPNLLKALRRAATRASAAGVEVRVNSGWRSPAYQDELLREAVSEYGSLKEAARWVSTPNTSAHVSGDAVDVGPAAAAAWLSEHGADYGLCQIYRNEPWHFELRPGAVTRGCPAMYADPTLDPRTRQ